jgi:hypothetical protein
LLQIGYIENPDSTLNEYPNAKIALEEAITIEINEGDMLFVPAFTWFQKKWIGSGLSVSHSGYADPLDANQQAILNFSEEFWKYTMFCLHHANNNLREYTVRAFTSLGRHPRGQLAKSLVDSIL